MTRWMLPLAVMLGMLTGCAERGTVVDDGAITAGIEGSSEGGIGGTGAVAGASQGLGDEDAEGGIGGTGIFGTITGFGSIFVGGLAVDFDRDVVEPLESTIGQDLPLTLGSTALVEAGRKGDRFEANRVSLFLPLVGPIEHIDPSSGTLEVMGTLVRTGGDTGVFDRRDGDGELPSIEALRPGDRVAVNGIWNGTEVIAARLDRLKAGDQASLSGLLLRDGDLFTVGGSVLADGCCIGLETPVFVEATGSYREGRFDAERLQIGVNALFSEAVDRLVVEAFLARDPVGDGFHLSGFGIPADQSAVIETETGVRSLFVGRFDRRFEIQSSQPLPEDESERIRTLQRLGPSLLER